MAPIDPQSTVGEPSRMSVTPRLDQRGRRLAVLALVALLAIPLLPAVASASPSTFLPYVAYASVPDPEAVAIGDVTGDGLADAVVTTGSGNDPAYEFKLAVLAQQPGGTLAAPVFFDTAGSYPSRPDSVGIGDVTGDDLPDVVVGIDDIGVQVFPGIGGWIGQPTLTPTPDGRIIRLGELDGDGRLDVAAVGWGTDTVTILSDTGTGLEVRATYAAPHAGYDDLEIGDVTGDGLDDVVVMSGQSYAVDNFHVLAQQANGTLAAAVAYDLGGDQNASGVAIGDVSGDGRNDVLLSYGGNRPSSKIGVFHQAVDGTLLNPYSLNSYDIPEPLEMADLDGDGYDDVVTAHGGWNAVGLYGSIAGGDLWPEQLTPVPYASHYGVQGLAIGDLTGDGRPDVALADYNHGLVVLANAGVAPNPSPSYTPSPTATPTPVPTPTATPVPVKPSAPQGLATSPNLAAGVGLSWQAPATPGTFPVTGYRIYRGASQGSAPTFLASVGNVLSFTDATAVNGTTRWYSVSAVSAAGEGPRSTEVIAVRGTSPSAPMTLAASAPRPGQVGLTWQAPSSNGGSAVTGYVIYRGTASGQSSYQVTVGAGSTSFTDASVGKKVKYFYRITAVNVLGESAFSNEVTITTK